MNNKFNFTVLAQSYYSIRQLGFDCTDPHLHQVCHKNVQNNDACQDNHL